MNVEMKNKFDGSTIIMRIIKSHFLLFLKPNHNILFYSPLPIPKMNKIQPRISFQPGLNYSYQKPQELHEPSVETKKLIQYLQLQKGQKLQDKLRQEVFFSKFQIALEKTRDQTRKAEHHKLNISSHQKKFHQITQGVFGNKRSPVGRKVFFSPKATRSPKFNHETPSFVQIDKEFPENQSNQTEKKTFDLKNSSKFETDPFHSEKQISQSKDLRQCPEFFKKSNKTSTRINETSEIPKIKIEDFKIVKNLGEGTFGEVVQAYHKVTGSVYTIKIYKKEIIRRHELEEKFIHDIKVQLRMNHPNIVKLYGFFDDPTDFYMVFEFMESGDLTKIIEEQGGKMSQPQIYRKIFEINDALLYLHDKKLIHRDIKPVSVLTCLDVCKLCDTEWLQETASLPHHSTLCRELDYMAPEALEGKQITNQFDIWGLGMIAYELLSGKKLIQGANQKLLIRKIISLNKELIQILIPTKCSYELKKFIISALDPIPSKRITSKAINQMKLEKEAEFASGLIPNRRISFQEKSVPITIQEMKIGSIPRSPPKSAQFFGIKKEIRNEVSTLL